MKRDVQSNSHSQYEPLLVCIPTTTGSHSDHYWFTFGPLLVRTPTTTGSHLEVVVVRTPLLYTLMLYASRGSDFTIYKNKSSPCAKASHRGSLLDWAQCQRRLLSCRDFLEDLQEVTPPEVYRLDLDTLSG